MCKSRIALREVSIMRIRHWQDAASLLLGVWLVLSPFALGFAGAATWMTIVLGLCVILFALEGFVIPSYLEEWGEILLGFALLVAPWVVGYEPNLAIVNSVVSGLLVILFAAWELATDRDFMTWWHDHWHRTAN
jgi:SPW repeat